MRFALTEEQRLQVETSRRFVQSQLVPLEDEVERSGALDPA